MTKMMTTLTKCPGSIPLPFGQIFEYLNHLYTLCSFKDLKDNVVNDDDENDDNADKMSRLYSSSLRPSFLMAPPWTHSIPSDITHLYFVFPNISNMSNSLSYLDHLDHQDVWGHRPFMPHIFIHAHNLPNHSNIISCHCTCNQIIVDLY